MATPTSIAKYANGFASKRDAKAMNQLLGAVLTDLTQVNTITSSRCLSPAGLVIKAGASPLVKNGNLFHVIVNGVLVQVAANTDMAALSGTVANAAFNVFVFYVDAVGARSSAMGTAGATLAAVVLPTTPTTKVMVGFVIINPTGTGSFVGGTTALDDATVVPNAVYVSTTGAVNVNTLSTTA